MGGSPEKQLQKKELENLGKERGSGYRKGALELEFLDVEWEGQVGCSRCKVIKDMPAAGLGWVGSKGGGGR